MSAGDGEPEQEGSAPGSRWPAWRFDSGYAELAGYVTPEAIADNFDFRASLTAEEEEAAGSEAGMDLLRAERLYEQLAAREVFYDREPWTPKEDVQQIRHAWWVLNGRLGNCLA